ncbi:MAG: efflux RND transporter permease subunit [Rhodanobacter sp.]
MNVFAPMIRRPAGTSLLAIGLILAGWWAYTLLGVASLPSLQAPVAFVSAQMPGANSQTMANTVMAPLERHLGRIPGVKQMIGTASEGSVQVLLLFDFGVNIEGGAREAQAAINAAAPDLPSGLPSPPQVFKFDTSQVPVLLVTLTSESMTPEQLYDLSNNLLQPGLAQISGVARVDVFGGAAHAVRITLDTTALAAKGITSSDVANTLRAANVTSPQGILSDGLTQMTVTANDALRTPAQFSQLLIAVKGGTPVRLSDVATVDSGPQDSNQAAWFNGTRAVGLSISKRPDANSVEVAQAVRAKLQALRTLLPADVQVTPIFDLTQTTKSALHEVEIALLLSIAMVALVMLVFLRRVRPTLIAMVSVPMSLAGAFVVMWMLGFTLNLLSLIALVLCVGFVVDDAIVVIENIVRHMEKGTPPLRAALTGVSEIGFTVISITLSLIAVFAPLLFGNNFFTELMREFAVTLTATIVISALVSLTLIPALCGRYLSLPRESDRPPNALQRALLRFDRGLHSTYERSLDWAMHHRRIMRWQPLVLLGLTMLLAVAVAMTAGGGILPDEDVGMMQAHVSAEPNISPNQLARLAQEIAAVIQADPAVLDVTTTLGGNFGGGVGNSASMYIDLKPLGHAAGDRQAGVKDVVARLHEYFRKLPDVNVSVTPAQFANFGGGGGGGGGEGRYQFQLNSISGASLQKPTLSLARQMRTMKQFRDISTSFDNIGKQQLLQVNREAAARLHVGMGQIDDALYNAFGEHAVSIIYSDTNQYRVILTSSAAQTLSPSTLLNTYVRSSQGTMIPLSALAQIRPTLAPVSIRHFNQIESATINYNLAKGVTQLQALKLVDQAMMAAQVPAGVQRQYTGDNQQLAEAVTNAGLMLLAVILVMYVVLGVLYESLIHPLTILSTLPAAGMGAYLAMLVTQTQLTLMSVIAILMLIGIVKKNAILMVDFALVAEREHGMTPPQAIREAALVRFRPITMTTLVAMGAAVPLAIGFGVGSELRQPLGIAIFGGLLVSQLLTLLSTPAIYLWQHDHRERKAAKKKLRAEIRRQHALPPSMPGPPKSMPALPK